jgi:hypothetical protein
MTHISGFERSQLLLLPEAIDDYVVADNPVRFIDAFAGGVPNPRNSSPIVASLTVPELPKKTATFRVEHRSVQICL